MKKDEINNEKKEPEMLGTKLVVSKDEKKLDLQITLCYIGILILLVFALLPPVLRFLVPIEEETNENNKKTTYITRTCKKTIYRDDYSLVRVVVDKYKNDIVQSTNMSFYIYKTVDFEVDVESVFEDDIKDFLNIDKIKYSVTGNIIEVGIDYVMYPELKSLVELNDYIKQSQAQKVIYQNKGYACEEVINQE